MDLFLMNRKRFKKENVPFTQGYTFDYPIINSRIIEIGDICPLKNIKNIFINISVTTRR